MPSLLQVLTALDARYPAELAQSWDAVGLVCGDPAVNVTRVHFAVDATLDVVDEAVRAGAELLVAHHPVFLAAVHGVPATDPAGRVVHHAIRSGLAIYVAHTNADAVGVSDALADALGLIEVRPISAETPPMGRVGLLPDPVALDEFVAKVALALPQTEGGLRVSGSPDAVVQRIAVCGGAGGSMWPAALAAGADVLLTSDVGHHRLLDARAGGLKAVVDAAHWATEWPWLARAAALLAQDVATVATSVSQLRTDGWSWLRSSP